MNEARPAVRIRVIFMVTEFNGSGVCSAYATARDEFAKLWSSAVSAFEARFDGEAG